ncbi:MAG TPA: hypothetical protein VLR89_02635 [Anaerolineaceae bacterium]|nr:hypothetical protein [Anaerolineaceae bacterium]
MKAKAVKTPKQKRSKAPVDNPELNIKVDIKNEDGFIDSKALNWREIENLKDQLEELNRENTSGG